MVMTVDSHGPQAASLGNLNPWRRHGALSRDQKLGLSSPGSSSAGSFTSQVPKRPPSQHDLDFLLESAAGGSGISSDDEAGSDSLSFRLTCSAPAKTKPSRYAFTFSPASAPHKGFNFSSSKQTSAVGVSLKRRRHGQDVDGPNTAALPCKKRRIRVELITSRLSQPYSQPATHILNREGMESGDKRFLKMATSLDMARRIVHLHATSFLRYSLMNRLRRRLGLGQPGEAPIAAPASSDDVVMDGDDTSSSNSKAPWKAQSPSHGSLPQRHMRSPYGESHVAGRAAQPGGRIPLARLSKPAALPLPSADLAAAVKLTAPRIHPMRSPELRPVTDFYDNLEEDSFAFLHPDDETSSELSEDPEHVYNDFDLIFGGGGGDGGGEASSPSRELDEHTYEEYIDELDGISWVTR